MWEIINNTSFEGGTAGEMNISIEEIVPISIYHK